MYVGVAIFELHIGQSRSLKDKRAVVRALRARLRKLELSVAEVGFQDLHQRCRLAVAAVSSDGRVVERMLNDAGEILDGDGDAVLTGTTREILPFDESVDLGGERRKYEQ